MPHFLAKFGLASLAPSGKRAANGTTERSSPLGAALRLLATAAALLAALPAPSFGQAASFATWQAATPRAGDQPGDNWDGDLFDDLLEYALGSDPATGRPVRAAGPAEFAGLRLATTPAGSVTASVWKPGTVSDVGYALERSTDLLDWYSVPGGSISPSGTGQLVSWADVNAGKPTGFVRLRVTLPGSPDFVSRTAPLGWAPVSFATGTQSYGLTLSSEALYSSTVHTTGSDYVNVPPSESADLRSLLPPGRPVFLEFGDLSAEGHRIEVNLAATASSGNPRRIILDLASSRNTTASLPAGIDGARFVLRCHELLGETFPKEFFKGTTSPPTADTVRIWTGATWQNYWLLDERAVNPSGRHRWVRSGDATLADQGALVLPPGSGCLFLRRGATPVTLLETGDLRPWRLRRSLPVGSHFLAGSYPLAQSANGLGLSSAGFLATASPASAGQFQVWQGDTSPATPSYLTAWLYSGSPSPWWVLTTDATLANIGDQPLFLPCRAHFEVPKQPVNYLHPLPSGVSSFPLAANPMHDSDADGLPDTWELRYYPSITTVAATADLDGDFFSMISEFLALTSPLLADTDGDRWDDGQEAEIGADPTDFASTPTVLRPNLEQEAVFIQFALNSYFDLVWGSNYIAKPGSGLSAYNVTSRSANKLLDTFGEEIP